MTELETEFRSQKLKFDLANELNITPRKKLKNNTTHFIGLIMVCILGWNIGTMIGTPKQKPSLESTVEIEKIQTETLIKDIQDSSKTNAYFNIPFTNKDAKFIATPKIEDLIEFNGKSEYINKQILNNNNNSLFSSDDIYKKYLSELKNNNYQDKIITPHFSKTTINSFIIQDLVNNKDELSYRVQASVTHYWNKQNEIKNNKYFAEDKIIELKLELKDSVKNLYNKYPNSIQQLFGNDFVITDVKIQSGKIIMGDIINTPNNKTLDEIESQFVFSERIPLLPSLPPIAAPMNSPQMLEQIELAKQLYIQNQRMKEYESKSDFINIINSN